MHPLPASADGAFGDLYRHLHAVGAYPAFGEKVRPSSLVRQGESGIREDWLFAWREGGKRKRLITIAHQDDCYCRDYAKTVLAMYERYPDMTLFCSDYVTLKTRESRMNRYTYKTRESRMADGTYYPVQTRICAGDLVGW